MLRFLNRDGKFILAACGEMPWYYKFINPETVLQKALGNDIDEEVDYVFTEDANDATQFNWIDAMSVITSASEIGILEIVQPVEISLNHRTL